ncbi:DUF1211 domain-containing protein, partial [Staphylococcus warneri]
IWIFSYKKADAYYQRLFPGK